MKRQVNSILLKSLISTEFLILQGKPMLRANKLTHSASNKANYRIGSSLNLFELVRSLKQFVRVLQLLKGYEGGKLIVSSSNKSAYAFLDLYSKKVACSNLLDIRSECTRSFGASKDIRGLLLLDESVENKVTNIKKLMREKIVLITALNSIKENSSHSTYKIYNDIFDFKKLAFLMTLISSVVSDSKKN